MRSKESCEIVDGKATLVRGIPIQIANGLRFRSGTSYKVQKQALKQWLRNVRNKVCPVRLYPSNDNEKGAHTIYSHMGDSLQFWLEGHILSLCTFGYSDFHKSEFNINDRPQYATAQECAELKIPVGSRVYRFPNTLFGMCNL